STGKEVEIESPNLHKTTMTGTVQIPDGSPILMPVSYRPPGKGSEGKIWLLLARPFIWIDAEVQEIKQGGGHELSQKSVWESEIAKDEKPAPKRRLPSKDDVKQVLQAIITDVLTNPEFKSLRNSYGTEKDKTLALVDDDDLGWPQGFTPETHGYKLVEVQE